MTETLQWSFADRDSNELKLLTAYLRWGGTKYRQPPGKAGVPVARLMNGTPIKSGWDSRPSGNYIKLKGRCVLSYTPSIRNHVDPGQSRIKRGWRDLSIGPFCDDSNHLMIPVRTEFLWRVRDQPTDGRRDATNTRHRVSWWRDGIPLMISTWPERACIHGARMPVALIKETRRTDWNRWYASINLKSSNACNGEARSEQTVEHNRFLYRYNQGKRSVI